MRLAKPSKKNYLNASSKVCSPERIPKSTSAKITAAKAAITKTITVVKSTSRRVGQTTLDTSERTCWINCNGLLIAMDRPFKVVLHIMRFAVTFNPWSHQVARSYLPNCVYLFIAETAMLNTYPQKSLERRIFQTDRFANTQQKKRQPAPFTLAIHAHFQGRWSRQTTSPSKPPGCTADQLPCSADISHAVRASKTGFSKQRINSTWTRFDIIQAAQPVFTKSLLKMTTLSKTLIFCSR